MIRRKLAIPAVGMFVPRVAHAGKRWGFLAVLLCAPLTAYAQEHTRQACVDGINCYCDCVENTPGEA